MIVNARKTIIEKIKQYWISLTLIVIGLVIICLLILQAYNEYIDFENKIYREKISEKQKIDKLTLHKYPLVCDKIYYAPNQYDLVAINGGFIIETLESIGNPNKSIPLKQCQIYDKKTQTIVVPQPLTMEAKIAKLVNDLETKNNELLLSVTKLTDENKQLSAENSTKTTEINNLVALVNEKQKNIVALSIITDKYTYTRELLELSISNKPKLEKMVTEYLDKIKPKDKVVLSENDNKIINKALQTVHKNTTKIIDDIELSKVARLQIKLFTIRQLSKKMGVKDRNTTFKVPTLNELETITVTDEQIAEFASVEKKLSNTIAQLATIYSNMICVDQKVIMYNINESILQVKI